MIGSQQILVILLLNERLGAFIYLVLGFRIQIYVNSNINTIEIEIRIKVCFKRLFKFKMKFCLKAVDTIGNY